MAQTTYQSPIIAAPGLAAKRRAAYDALSVLIAHIRDGIDHPENGYTMDIVSLDRFVTTPQRITLTLTDPLPAGQIDRYNLTQV